MSTPLFKATTKSNWILTVIFFALMFMYMGSFLSLYSPESTATLENMLASVPEQLTSMMGISELSADLTQYLGNFFYGMLIFLIPLIYIGIMGVRLITTLVDNGSMAYLLSTPSGRVKIAMTRAAYFIASITALFVIFTGATIGLCEAIYPGMLEVALFIQLNVLALLFTLTVSSICWFFSCLFNNTKYAIALGAGVPVLMFLLSNFTGGLSDNMNWLSYLSVYHLFNASEILQGDANVFALSFVFVTITAVLYTVGIVIFKKKNLPI